MTPNAQAYLKSFAESVIEQVRLNLRDKPVTRYGAMQTTGKTAASLRYELTEDTLTIYGASHVFAVEYGRGPGGFPNVESLRQWVVNKGIASEAKDRGRDEVLDEWFAGVSTYPEFVEREPLTIL